MSYPLEPEEKERRHRVVKGWVFRDDLSDAGANAIRKFLRGEGDCPQEYGQKNRETS